MMYISNKSFTRMSQKQRYSRRNFYRNMQRLGTIAAFKNGVCQFVMSKERKRIGNGLTSSYLIVLFVHLYVRRTEPFNRSRDCFLTKISPVSGVFLKLSCLMCRPSAHVCGLSYWCVSVHIGVSAQRFG